jgi:endonuclease G
MSTTPPSAATPPVHLILTRPEAAWARSLVKEFEALPEARKEALRAALKAEDPDIYQVIRDARDLVAARKFTTVSDKVRPVAIDDLPARLGWEPKGWQMTLLRSLDDSASGLFRNPGQVTVSELVSALRNPDDPSELTTAAYGRLERVLTATAGSAQAEVSIASLDTEWERQVARFADANGDGKVSAQELADYLKKDKRARNRLTLQSVGVMLHQVAALTGEPDPYKLGALGNDSLIFIRSAYAGAYNKDRHLATVVAQAITADDIIERRAFKRDDKFRADGQLAKDDQVTPGDFAGTGFDKGHLASNADASSVENAFESFLMSNMAPQYPALNRGSWRFLEDRVRDVIVAAGARALVYTGTLFVDTQGQPMKAAQVEGVQHIGKSRVAVPTHSFKSVLLRFPDGRMSTMSFMVENRKNLPKKEVPCGTLLRRSRVSAASLEHLSGVPSFFDGFIPREIEAAMKADHEALLQPPAGTSEQQQGAFRFLFGQASASTVWRGSLSRYEADALLTRLSDAIAGAKRP